MTIESDEVREQVSASLKLLTSEPRNLDASDVASTAAVLGNVTQADSLTVTVSVCVYGFAWHCYSVLCRFLRSAILKESVS